MPGLTILCHPDPGRIGEQALLPGLLAREVPLARQSPEFTAPGSPCRRALLDPFVSRSPVRLAPAPGSSGIRLRPSPSIRLSVDGAEVVEDVLLPGSALDRGVVLVLCERIALLLHRLGTSPPEASEGLGLIGASAAVTELRREIRRVAELAIPVLVRGESGTGKELVAAAIHRLSPRRHGPYLAVNMAAVPATLAAAELFGAVKGAYTGSQNARRGYFQQTDGGTLFLDEIAATPMETQDLLLRALENGEIQPVGAERPQRVDVRIVAATDADLEAAAAQGSFREPLLYRLGGWEIRVPPLRERRDDIARLLLKFLRDELAALGAADRLRPSVSREQPWLPAELVARLVGYSWPGNVRQLRNVARQLAVASYDRDRIVLPDRIERALSADPPSAPAVSPRALAGPAPLPSAKTAPAYRSPATVKDEELLAALRRNRWRLKPTAEALGVSRTSLYGLIERCPMVRKAADLSQEEIAAALEQAGGDADRAIERLEVSRHGFLLRLRELGRELDEALSPG